jgi:hypothetical protein
VYERERIQQERPRCRPPYEKSLSNYKRPHMFSNVRKGPDYALALLTPPLTYGAGSPDADWL